jgi:hypothetical protein
VRSGADQYAFASVSDQLLTVLKFCVLALIYLFFFRVLRAVWAEITPPKEPKPAKPPKGARGRAAPVANPPEGAPRRPTVAAPAGVPVAVGAAGGAAPARAGRSSKTSRKSIPRRLVVVEPAEARGRSVDLPGDLSGELTLGRAPTCTLRVDDTFASQLHARLASDGANYVVEDLGSTNGTYLNEKKLAGAMIVQRGDRLRVGNTVLELE